MCILILIYFAEENLKISENTSQAKQIKLFKINARIKDALAAINFSFSFKKLHSLYPYTLYFTRTLSHFAFTLTMTMSTSLYLSCYVVDVKW